MTVIGCASRRATTLAPAVQPSSSPACWIEPFDHLDPAQWREVVLGGHTLYDAVLLDGQPCLRARSHASVSILIHAFKGEATHCRWLSWQWRVDQAVHGEVLDQKSGSDSAARLYVYFEAPGLPWQKRSVDYVWSTTLPVGTVVTSPVSPMSKLLIAESGTNAAGQWRTVQRNVEEDYRRCFGQQAPPIAAIGIMSDTDNTRSDTLAYFRDIRLSRSATSSTPSHTE
ncbi:MAG: DUF3047 domain-containing protein [Candidatus Omnitrophica bacterium]|nr:DUF3047 domain-containing protein [Candidatus Omnitrophota bacterium]